MMKMMKYPYIISIQLLKMNKTPYVNNNDLTD